ncbi:protein binding protein [Dorcoceras hygrometricum]|uniref:Protein binding protein n=1 Tax=Dorcoceras hygrometricum TaxID=472368 RepID=A0A2Z7CGL4_9LAMI|nr:protein binding protein [Dorcoceras hygrometricum]
MKRKLKKRSKTCSGAGEDGQLATERRESAATKEKFSNKVSCPEIELQLLRNDNCGLQNVVTLYYKNIDCRTSQLVEAKKEYKSNQVALEASHTTTSGHTEIGRCMSKKIERMKDLQEDNGVTFDDEWKEEPEENPEDEGLVEIPVEAVGEGEIVDE